MNILFFFLGSNSIEQSPIHRQYRNPSASGIHDEPVGQKKNNNFFLVHISPYHFIHAFLSYIIWLYIYLISLFLFLIYTQTNPYIIRVCI